jgi:hypothetical protein
MISDSAARQLTLILPSMARLDLTDDERDELLRALRGIVDNDRFPLSPRIRRLKAILDKLSPPPPAAAAGRTQPRAKAAAAMIIATGRREPQRP